MDFLDVPYPHIKVTLNNLSYYIEFDPITRWRGEDQDPFETSDVDTMLKYLRT